MTTGSHDETLNSLGDSIATVLEEEANSLAVHAYIDGRNRLDHTLWARAAELGWLAIGLPERCGGLGLGAPGLAMLFGKLGAHAAPGPFLSTLCATQALSDATPGTEVDQWLNQVIAGECRIAIPAQIDPCGPGSGGTILFLGDADSNLFLAPLGEGKWGLVRPSAADIVRLDMWDRTRGVVRVRLEQAQRVMVISNGGMLAQRLSFYLALALAADSLGGSRSLLGKTIDYMKGRRQFDRPIASFQALKHRVADMMTLIVAGAPAIEQVLASIGADAPEAQLWACLNKAKLTEDFVFISQECLQLHGGVGFTWEFDIHIFLKRARLNEMLLAPGWALRDRGAEVLATMVIGKHSPLELPVT